MTVCMGVTKSYAGLVVCRFFLGLFEAGFFPGIVVWLVFQEFPDMRQAACTSYLRTTPDTSSSGDLICSFARPSWLVLGVGCVMQQLLFYLCDPDPAAASRICLGEYGRHCWL